MSYVTYVFQKLFGYSRDKATKLMLDVHHKGRAVVSSGAARAGRARRLPAPRARPVGDHGAGVVIGRAAGSGATVTAASGPGSSASPSGTCCGCCPSRPGSSSTTTTRRPSASSRAYTDDDAAAGRLPADDGRVAARPPPARARHPGVDRRRATIDEDELHEWLDAVEVLRLVLGTQLDVCEDFAEVDADDPRSAQIHRLPVPEHAPERDRRRPRRRPARGTGEPPASDDDVGGVDAEGW